MKQRVSPSAIHSMVIIRLLSNEIAPKLFTMGLVGKRWAIPHTVMTRDPMSSTTYLRIMIIPSFSGVIRNRKNVFEFMRSSQ
jgi:hypothetical protein